MDRIARVRAHDDHCYYYFGTGGDQNLNVGVRMLPLYAS